MALAAALAAGPALLVCRGDGGAPGVPKAPESAQTGAVPGAPEAAPRPGPPHAEVGQAPPGIEITSTRAFRTTPLLIEKESPIVDGSGTMVQDLGIEKSGGLLQQVLLRGSRQPSMNTLTVAAGREGQREIRLHVVRGTSGLVAEDTSLGWFRVGDLVPGTDGKARVTMVFRVADGAVGLAAVDLKTGRSFRVEPVEPPPAQPAPGGPPRAG